MKNDIGWRKISVEFDLLGWLLQEHVVGKLFTCRWVAVFFASYIIHLLLTLNCASYAMSALAVKIWLGPICLDDTMMREIEDRYFIFTSLQWLQIQGQESWASHILYIPPDLGHSLACYLLCLVEAAVVGRAFITCSWWHWWEGLLFGRHSVLAPMVIIVSG